MNSAGEVANRASADAQIAALREQLADITRQCEAATREGKAGQLFYLLRKKWALTQNLSQAEHASSAQRHG